MIMFLMIIGCAQQQKDTCTDLYYENFGADFLQENCQGCHASEAYDREGAPADVYFDTKEDVRTHVQRIIVEMEEETMPPAGGLYQDELEAFRLWLSCLEEES